MTAKELIAEARALMSRRLKVGHDDEIRGIMDRLITALESLPTPPASEHEATDALVLWRCLYTEDDRDCDGTYFLPPVFVLASHEDDAWNRADPLVEVPDGCHATGIYEARHATDEEAQGWLASLRATEPRTAPAAPPVAGEPEREALREIAAESLRDVAYTCGRVWEAWQYGTMTQDDFTPAWEVDELTGGIADAILAAGYTKPRTVATVEELDALPVGSVVAYIGDQPDSPAIACRANDGWQFLGEDPERRWYSFEMAPAQSYPLIVLHDPRCWPFTPSTEEAP